MHDQRSHPSFRRRACPVPRYGAGIQRARSVRIRRHHTEMVLVLTQITLLTSNQGIPRGKLPNSVTGPVGKPQGTIGFYHDTRAERWFQSSQKLVTSRHVTGLHCRYDNFHTSSRDVQRIVSEQRRRRDRQSWVPFGQTTLTVQDLREEVPRTRRLPRRPKVSHQSSCRCATGLFRRTVVPRSRP